MFITPIQPIQQIGAISGSTVIQPSAKTGDSSLFKGIFENAVKNVVETDTQVAQDVRDLATGEMDDLHTLGIDAAKAQLAIEFLVQLRNRAVESYNELMRISL